ncbi:MAG: 23S rRNA (guanosine(2251)-2'-O)-methyltransferase RlmB [Bacillota bacterium]|mgnify:FL=1|jgi:23S rRNA (guanosine2251-2'-O)-methyltransferase|nr:23S rRNA (guanosine(2251)-2'-O)-methyltransferase RlmB [Bacillota bacterium]NLL26059.1 23S rRNA (guanosine(2251)-2'-O)-methyltransferase RlmB [Erysipelotrichia bacterium]
MTQLVYGKNVVLNLLKKNKEIDFLYIQKSRTDDDVLYLAKKSNVNYKIVDRKFLDNLVKGNHQGYVAQIKEYKTFTVEEIMEAIPEGKQPLLVALDGLEDPHNLGAILRTAACVGVDGVIIEKNRSVSLNSTVAKVSVGAIDIVKVARVTNLSQTLKKLKDNGYWVIGTDIEDAQDYRSIDYNMPVVLIIGSEGKGMRRLVKENCDIKVMLPMESDIGSLNASVACAVLLYQIYSQRFPLK